MNKYQLTDWIPTTKKEVKLRGWDELDVIFFSGDAYIDHPAFGPAVICRILESMGLKVAIVPQPNWRDDLRDFKKLGKPRLFFGVSAGAMDSMVNMYTANRRLRSEDAYTPDARNDMRPEYPSIVYTQILKRFFPDVPVVLGGIEASLRRLAHYDYWKDQLMRSFLIESGADYLMYGMGDQSMRELVQHMENGESKESICTMNQIVYASKTYEPQENDLVLSDYETCLHDKKAHAKNFRHIEEESNRVHAKRLIQKTGNQYVIVNPPNPPMSTELLDATHDLPYTRLPHPKYKDKRIPAYEMIRHSITLHRGCFGGCAFCTISAHQGKFIASRSKANIMREVEQVTQMEDFKGYISDLGGPSANMYQMQGYDLDICAKCKRPSCVHPKVCPNLNTDHRPMLDIYHDVDALPNVKKSFIGSGVRYDLLQHRSKDEEVNKAAQQYTEELIKYHVSGRLTVAPEHTCDHVLNAMRKPSFSQFKRFKQDFDRINEQAGLKQQLIPYFISSHPSCREEDMADLAVETKNLNFRLEQVQDFTPTPMTVSTETWYTGYDPYTLEPVYSAKTPKQKQAQRLFFFWYQQDKRGEIICELKKMNRNDLIDKLYGGGAYMPRREFRNSPRAGGDRRSEQGKKEYSPRQKEHGSRHNEFSKKRRNNKKR